jgi:hypothetical protein
VDSMAITVLAYSTWLSQRWYTNWNHQQNYLGRP